MLLEVEDRDPVDDVTPAKLRRAIRRLRSRGPCSYVILTAVNGSYIQAAGGPATCMMERRDAATGRHERAFKDKRSAVFADGTRLPFGAGSVILQADEWFLATDVAETFLAGAALPERIRWRDMPPILPSAAFLDIVEATDARDEI